MVREEDAAQRILGGQHFVKTSKQEESVLSWDEVEVIAADRVRWRNLLPIVPQGIVITVSS